jgi:ATP-dependent helicase/DNAse subunit B
VSASSLAPYYQCSLKWLFERVLDLENVRIEAGLMEENIAGLVYHAVLNLFFSELEKNNEVLAPPVYAGEGQESPSLPDAYRGLLAQNVHSVFAGLPCLPHGSEPAMSALTARLLRAEQKHFHSRLENCLAVFLAWFAGFRVIGSETSYQAERDSYFLKGIVDCILEDARENSESRGAALIVDFKLRYLPDLDDCTGAGENGLANFQLPMYLVLAEENKNRPVHTALFFSIVDAEPEVLFGAIQHLKNKTWLPKKEDQRIMRESGLFQHIINEFEVKTEQFAEEITSGGFSVFSPDNEKCGACNYHRVCRTMYKIDREQNSLSRGGDDGT